MDSKVYKKEKIFRSKIKMYKVEIEIQKDYSMFQSRLLIRLFDKEKYHKFHEEIHLADKKISNSDLDVLAINCIKNYEDWKVIY